MRAPGGGDTWVIWTHVGPLDWTGPQHLARLFLYSVAEPDEADDLADLDDVWRRGTFQVGKDLCFSAAVHGSWPYCMIVVSLSATSAGCLLAATVS